jgi:hypothetical protein
MTAHFPGLVQYDETTGMSTSYILIYSTPIMN